MPSITTITNLEILNKSNLAKKETSLPKRNFNLRDFYNLYVHARIQL